MSKRGHRPASDGGGTTVALLRWIPAMTQHREVPVKVNAWVDEGIADLVSALSELDGLVTLESCQGDVGEREAFVIFQYGDWLQCGEFLFGKILPNMSPDLRVAVSLKLQAYDNDTASGFISIEPSAVPNFVDCIRGVLRPPIGSSVFVARHAHSKAVA